MNKTLRIALCGLEGQDPASSPAVQTVPGELVAVDESNEKTEVKTITMSGPLSEIYTKALRVLFAKVNSVTQQTSMESQANDAIMAIAGARAAARLNSTEEGAASISREIEANQVDSIYGEDADVFITDSERATPDTVKQAAINVKLEDPNKRFIYVIEPDNVQSNTDFAAPNGGDVFNLTALESLCKDSGITLVYGLGGLIEALKPKSLTT